VVIGLPIIHFLTTATMTKHRNRKHLTLLERCLRDVKTGKLWLSAADRRKYQSRFGELGVEVSKPFTGEEALLSAWCQSLSTERGIVLYELARLTDPTLPPLVADLERWPKAQREEYLLLRIQAKLHHLFETKEVILAWLEAYQCDRYLTPGETGEFDGAAIVELDRVLTEMIEGKPDADPRPPIT
jgi:hypothetical protein